MHSNNRAYKQNDYKLSKETVNYAQKYFKTRVDNREQNFGNAREVHNVFEKAFSKIADRVTRIIIQQMNNFD